MDNLGPVIAIILTIFYLYLAVRSDRVKRPVLFWIGALALASAMILGIFLIIDSRAVRIVFSILMVVLLVASFLVGLAAAFGGQLPVRLAETRAPTRQDETTGV
ncbi:MAG: hypothetical protein ABFD92_20805 [Planctomycetaceae bacterium]|nr:hypothetical protein [Planctomycetaceae bacterium]